MPHNIRVAVIGEDEDVPGLGRAILDRQIIPAGNMFLSCLLYTSGLTTDPQRGPRAARHARGTGGRAGYGYDAAKTV